MDGTRARWARYLRWAGPVLIGLGLLLATPAVASADPGSAGPSFQGGKSAPSGSKPESKLWYNDGFWWGNLYDTATDDFYIWRLDLATGSWIRTNTVTDTRGDTRSDALWDGSKLYIANYKWSEGDSGNGSTRLRRFSYNAATDTYSLDAGFPTTIDTFRHEAFVIAKDSTGQLWATYEREGSIWVNRSTTSDSTWGTPFAIPGSVTVDSDDISSVIAFGGDRIGVLWSNQDTETDYFAVHLDSAGDTSWGTVETAYSGNEVADDHINLKTDASGRVYAAVKTSQSPSSLVLLVRQPNGTWSNHLVISDSDATRPIVLLDETNARIRVFYTVGLNGGPIVEKSSSMATISFSGAATVVMEDDVENDLNNVTSTKQNVTAGTSLVLLASNDTSHFYWWTEVLGTPPSDVTPPTKTGQAVNGASLVITYDEPLDGGSDPVGTAFAVTVNGSSRGVTSVNAGGTTVTLTLASPVVSSDSVTAAYTMPSSGSRVQDVAGNDAASFAATGVTNNTPPTGGGGSTTFTAVEDAQVKSSSATTNYGNATTMRLREESGGTTYQSYLQFNVSGLSGTVTSVKLRLYVTDAGPDSGHVHAVPNTWSESTLNWNNRPVIGGAELGSAGASTVGQYIEFDLGAGAVTGNGIYSFGIRTTSTNSVIFNTSEAASNRPQLVVTTSAPPSDTTAPLLTGATVNGTSLVLTYDEPLDGASDPAGGDFIVNGTSTHTVGSANAAGTTVTLSLDSAVVNGETVTISYTPGSNPIRDVAANPAATLTAEPVNNTTPPSDTTAPLLTGATVNGTSLVLTYDEPLDGSSDPAGGDFTVSGGHTVSTADASGTTVTLSLDSAVVNGETVTISYTPGSNPIRDVAANSAATLTAEPVNNTTPPSDTTAPLLSGATVNGTSLVLTYNEPLDGASDPAGGDFTVTGSVSGAHTVSTADASGTTVTLTLATPVVNGETVTISYTPGSKPIQDVAGNDAATLTAEPVNNTTPPAGGSRTFTPFEDAQVKSTSANTNYGNDTTLRLREESGGTTYQSYIKFNVTGLTGPVTSVKLRLFVTDNSTNTTSVYTSPSTWAESTLTWTNRPTMGTTVLGSGVPSVTDAWVEIDLGTGAISDNGTYSFGLRNSGTTSAIFSSSEAAAANRPQLVVTYGS